MRKNLKVLFFGRKSDIYTNKIEKFLKKKKCVIKKFYCENSSDIPNNQILKWKGDLIICFRSFYILKKPLLKKAKYGGINFHPAPPSYRGVGTANFALYKNEKNFGVTAHLINEKIDDGKILNVKKFKIKKNDNLKSLLNKAYKQQILQVYELLENLINNDFDYNIHIKKFKNIKWSKQIYTQKKLSKLYQIKINIKKSVLKKRLRATIYKNYYPYINLNNKKIYLYE